MRERAALILNPASGRARGKTRVRETLYRLAREGAVVSLHLTEQPGDARRLAADLASGADVLVSVGGDGTLNEVVNGVLDAGASTPVAVVPLGTANVVAGELGLHDKPKSLAWAAVHGPERCLDLGLARPAAGAVRRFIMCAGAGLDGRIVDQVSRERTRRGITMLDYSIPAVTSFLQYDFPPMRVTVDGRVVDEASTFTLIGNMRRYGGPFRFFHDATPDDGFLDVCCLHGRHQLDLLRYGLSTVQRTLASLPDVAYHRGHVIELTSDREVLVQVDGDRGGSLPMRFEVLPAAVRFCVVDLDPHGESAQPPPGAEAGDA
jgi:YegS/Rv2252/BmrU family lipid kinase